MAEDEKVMDGDDVNVVASDEPGQRTRPLRQLGQRRLQRLQLDDGGEILKFKKYQVC